MQQISIYRIFALDILHGNITAHYEVDTKYLRITWDETMALEISDKQYSTCKEANGQFCNIYTPFQPLANAPSCITALYSKNFASIATRCSLQIRKAHTVSIPTLITSNVWIITSLQSTIQTGITYLPVCLQNWLHYGNPSISCDYHQSAVLHDHIFYLPPHCEPTSVTLNISLEIANINMINISALDFCTWQHLENQQNETQLQHLASIPLVPVDQLYKHMISDITPITPFTSPEESTGDTVSIWTLVFSHRSLFNGYRIAYTSRIGDILLLFLLLLTCQISAPTVTTRYHAVYCCGWWCRGSTHLQMWWQGQTAHKTLWNYGLCMEWVPTWMESWEATDAVISSSCMQVIVIYFQNPGNTDMYIISVVRLRIRPDIATPAWIDRCTLNINSHFTQLDINSTCSPLKNNTHMACAHAFKGHAPI